MSSNVWPSAGARATASVAKFHVALPDHVQDERTAVLIAPHASKSDYFLNARPPTARTLPANKWDFGTPSRQLCYQATSGSLRREGGNVAFWRRTIAFMSTR